MNKDGLESLARNIRRQSGIVSIDPVRLAESAGPIDVFNISADTDYVSGMSVKDGGRIRIYVNDKLDIPWKRFVITKELAHILLDDREHESSAEQLVSTLSAAPDLAGREGEAAALAGALLIDGESAAQAWLKLQDIDAMARLYQVPPPIMERRLVELGLLRK